MKRVFALILTFALALSLAACASGGETSASTPSAPAETQSPAASEAPKLVTNIDDLLAALAPNTEILLAEGEFHIDQASDYGSPDTGDYYSWEGSSLQLRNLDGLTIRGCGKGKTTLVTDPRSANVLELVDCKNVTLTDMTLGHTVRADACEGDVLRIHNCENTTLKGLGLYGCGAIGVNADRAVGLTMQDCEVYNCSSAGVSFYESGDITVNSCSFHSLGEGAPVYSVFSVFNCENVTVSNCMVSNNYVYNVINCGSVGTVTFRNNQFTANQTSSAFFSIDSDGIVVVMEDNVFEDNQLRNWYAGNSARAVDMAGNEVVLPEIEAPEAMDVTPGVATPVSTGTQKEVTVKTADEFLAAIASDTCIILDTELLDLSTAASYKAADAAFAKQKDTFEPTYRESGAPYYWVDNFDGPSLVIDSVDNLTIQSAGGDRKACTISATPRYAYVLTFENCSAITLSGFTSGHTKEPGECAGGVLQFMNCSDVLMDNCGMFGCGTIGVDAKSSLNIQVVNSEIYECSYQGISLDTCDNVAISGTIIRDIGSEWGPSPFYNFRDSRNVTLDGKPLDGNYSGN